jgi:hypothetical protein
MTYWRLLEESKVNAKNKSGLEMQLSGRVLA